MSDAEKLFKEHFKREKLNAKKRELQSRLLGIEGLVPLERLEPTQKASHYLDMIAKDDTLDNKDVLHLIMGIVFLKVHVWDFTVLMGYMAKLHADIGQPFLEEQLKKSHEDMDNPMMIQNFLETVKELDPKELDLIKEILLDILK